MNLHGENHYIKNLVYLGFAAVALAFLPAQSLAQTISCSSDDTHWHSCPMDTRGGVRMVKQNSDSPCQQGYSWGWTMVAWQILRWTRTAMKDRTTATRFRVLPMTCTGILAQ
jgi:hypothetical protein